MSPFQTENIASLEYKGQFTYSSRLRTSLTLSLAEIITSPTHFLVFKRHLRSQLRAKPCAYLPIGPT